MMTRGTPLATKLISSTIVVVSTRAKQKPIVAFRAAREETSPSLSQMFGLPLPSAFGALPTELQAFFEVRGLLMEHIQGYSLAKAKELASPSLWQPIRDEAIRVVNIFRR